MAQLICETGFVKDTWAGTIFPTLADYIEEPVLLLRPQDDINEIVPYFKSLHLIVVSFPSSADGRGFSQAAELRDIGYTGRLRAQGHVLVDQFRAALHAGIDEIEISDEQAQRNPEHQWLAVPLQHGYQTYLHSIGE
jgi:uncharacterized protein (DUF934 family)